MLVTFTVFVSIVCCGKLFINLMDKSLDVLSVRAWRSALLENFVMLLLFVKIF